MQSPNGCLSLLHVDGDDKFAFANDNQFVGEDAVRHRNSWLMPRLARRMTKNSEYHVSKWSQPVPASSDQCARIRKALQEQLGDTEAAAKLPKACRK